MKKISLLLFLFNCVFSLYSQNTETNSNLVKGYYFRDSIISMEKWHGNDKKIDSFKTFLKTGRHIVTMPPIERSTFQWNYLISTNENSKKISIYS